MLENFEPLIKLAAKEEKEFGAFIKTKRKELILSPKETAKRATENNGDLIKRLLDAGEISEVIKQLRQLSYDEFLKEEAKFNAVVLAEIGRKFDAPKEILNKVSDSLYELSVVSKEEFQEKVCLFFGTYAGAISPYVYQLCLSNTQSRRSRAGKTFEGIIYFLYEFFNYPYQSQSSIGKKAFSDLKLGKVVDSILPNKQAFLDRRTKTIVGSMKTTLRERWQEVVEEISRSNLPAIYLLTVDDDISDSKAEQMSHSNIVLVVLKEVKDKPKLKSRQSIIDFETYYKEEIPSVLKHWQKG